MTIYQINSIQIQRFQSFMYRDFTFSFLFQLWVTRIAKSLANPSPIPSPTPVLKSKNIASAIAQKELSSETLDGNEPDVKGDDSMRKECDCINSFHIQGHTLFDVVFPTTVKRMWEVWHTVIPDFVTNKQGASDFTQNILPINKIDKVAQGSVLHTSYKIPLGLYTPVTNITSTIETFVENENICMVSRSRTSDVPYGSKFETVVRICFMRDKSGVRVVGTYECVFLSDVNWLVKGILKVVNLF
jgi:hypothetical protein